MKELLHFTAEWCNPCKKIKPLIEDYVSINSDIEYKQINVDDFPKIASEYEILGIPTLIAKIDGKIVARHTGIATMNEISFLFDNVPSDMVE